MQLGMSTDSRVSTLGARGSQSTGRRKPRPRGCILAQPALASPLALSLSLTLSASLDLEVSTHHCALPRQHGLQEEFSKNYTFVPPRGARAFFVLPHEKGHWTRPGAKVDHGPLQLPFRKRPTSAFVPSAKQQTPADTGSPSHVLSGARWLAEPRPATPS